MATTSEPPNAAFRVAIVGAGIAGLTAAISLRRFYSSRDIQITIYEQATQLREVGASIALNPSGLRVLDKLGVHAALDGSNAFRQPSGWPMVYRHWLTDKELGHDEVKGEVEARHRMARFHRADLQRVLVEALPGDVEIRLGSSVAGVEVKGKSDENNLVDGSPVAVFFEDGGSIEVDLLVGADGIHSKTRRAFVSEHQLKWTGLVAFRAAFDASLLEGIDGLPDDTVFWVGHERTLFASRLGNHQYAVVGSYSSDPNDPESPHRNAKWNGPGNVEAFRALYKGWNPVVQSIVNAVPYVRTYPNYSGTALSSLIFDGRVALLGDAAHTHGGAFAAGGSLAINDAYALVLALARVWQPGSRRSRGPSQAQLETALGLYDDTRRPLVTRVLNLVHGSAQNKRAWTAEKRAESDEELRARIANRPDMSWLTEHDVEAEFQKVYDQYRSDQKSPK